MEVIALALTRRTSRTNRSPAARTTAVLSDRPKMVDITSMTTILAFQWQMPLAIMISFTYAPFVV